MPSTIINGSAVEEVGQYEYLGTFEANTDRIYNKVNERLFCLRKLRSFHIDSSLMKIFYSSFVESILTFALTCWFGTLRVFSH